MESINIIGSTMAKKSLLTPEEEVKISIEAIEEVIDTILPYMKIYIQEFSHVQLPSMVIANVIAHITTGDEPAIHLTEEILRIVKEVKREPLHEVIKQIKNSKETKDEEPTKH